jgi:hypothetical protein
LAQSSFDGQGRITEQFIETLRVASGPPTITEIKLGRNNFTFNSSTSRKSETDGHWGIGKEWLNRDSASEFSTATGGVFVLRASVVFPFSFNFNESIRDRFGSDSEDTSPFTHNCEILEES